MEAIDQGSKEMGEVIFFLGRDLSVFVIEEKELTESEDLKRCKLRKGPRKEPSA